MMELCIMRLRTCPSLSCGHEQMGSCCATLQWRPSDSVTLSYSRKFPSMWMSLKTMATSQPHTVLRMDVHVFVRWSCLRMPIELSGTFFLHVRLLSFSFGTFH